MARFIALAFAAAFFAAFVGFGSFMLYSGAGVGPSGMHLQALERPPTR